MKINDMFYDLLSLAKEESEPNRYAHSEEYDRLFDELDSKTLIIDELEEKLGCPLDVLGKVILQKYFYDIYGNKIDTDIGYINQNGITILVMSVEEWEEGKYCDRDLARYLKDYKKTWWLKEDRSE